MAGALKSTSEGSTLIPTISNPEFKNALGPEIYAAGIEALNAAENNPEIRSVVLASVVNMKNYREGDLVTVHGNILKTGRASKYLGGALYRAEGIDIVERSDP